MTKYPFHLLRNDAAGIDKEVLPRRPFAARNNSFSGHAARFVAGGELLNAVNAAIALGQPLLLSGEAGSGKTQVAYYVAQRLQLEPVSHFQVKHTSEAQDLLYHFDAARYYFDIQTKQNEEPNKAQYITPGPLWQAMAAKEPRILLIDEIDKAPRDFPNGLLHELDKMEFLIPEINKTYSAPLQRRPIVFITSNNEQALPDPFLRRCVYHPIRFNENLLDNIIRNHQDDFAGLSSVLIETAVERFLALRRRPLRKIPSIGEFLAWLQALALSNEEGNDTLDSDLSRLPHLGLLLKYREDMDELGEPAVSG